MAKAAPAFTGTIHVLCTRPGLRRAGIEHPAYRVLKRKDLSDEQLLELTSDPLLVLVDGVRITAEMLAGDEAAT
jgi:hypothetical protein